MVDTFSSGSDLRSDQLPAFLHAFMDCVLYVLLDRERSICFFIFTRFLLLPLLKDRSGMIGPTAFPFPFRIDSGTRSTASFTN